MGAKHTATPWEIDEYGTIKAGKDRLLLGGISIPCCVGPAMDESKANAEFIVRACNAHEDLVRIAETLKSLDEKEGLSPADLGYLRDCALAALAAAKS